MPRPTIMLRLPGLPAWMARAAVSRRELAAASDVSPGTVHRVLNGFGVSPRVARALARTLGCSVGALRDAPGGESAERSNPAGVVLRILKRDGKV